MKYNEEATDDAKLVVVVEEQSESGEDADNGEGEVHLVENPLEDLEEYWV
jgi:hypothetical protein